MTEITANNKSRDYRLYGPFLTRSRNVDTAWRSIVNTIIEKGSTVYTERKGQKTLECICGLAHLTDWRTGGITPQNYIGLTPQVIEQQYWPQYSSAERGEHTYTYGWCMRKRFGFDQIQHIIETLKEKSTTAFAQFWNPVVDSRSPDPPCINIVGFRKVKGRICMVEYIRSNDVARAWPEDVSGSYAVFLTEVAAHFGGASARGDIITVMGSAHIYETALEETRERFQSSYSASNQKPAENTSAVFGPVIRKLKDSEKGSQVIEEIAERYSDTISDAALYACLSISPARERGRDESLSVLDAYEGSERVIKALRDFDGKNDQGEPETIDQIAWASSKAMSTPESRRIVLTPNNPGGFEYSMNPVIIQFLVREGVLHTIAVYHDVKVDSVDEHYNLLKAISKEIKAKGRNVRLGPIIMILAPVIS